TSRLPGLAARARQAPAVSLPARTAWIHLTSLPAPVSPKPHPAWRPARAAVAAAAQRFSARPAPHPASQAAKGAGQRAALPPRRRPRRRGRAVASLCAPSRRRRSATRRAAAATGGRLLQQDERRRDARRGDRAVPVRLVLALHVEAGDVDDARELADAI